MTLNAIYFLKCVGGGTPTHMHTYHMNIDVGVVCFFFLCGGPVSARPLPTVGGAE